MGLATVEFWTATFCPYERSFFTQFLVLLYYSHYFITLAIFLEGIFRTKELYLGLLSFGITLTAWLAYLLLWTFLQPVPTPACGSIAFWCVDPSSPFNSCGVEPFPSPPPDGATCGATPLPPCDPCVPCGMPAVEPMLGAFTVASVGIFAFQWRAPHIKLYGRALIIAFFALVVYSHALFGYNTPAQIVAGAALGTAFALFYQLVVFAVAYPNFDRILAWPLVRRFGYRDTFCRADTYVPGDPEPMGVDGGVAVRVEDVLDADDNDQP